MTDTPVTPPDTIPWYRSNVLRALLVTIVTQALAGFHATAAIAPQAGPIVDAILQVISVGAAGFAAYSRVQHPLPNIVATQKQADTANSQPKGPTS